LKISTSAGDMVAREMRPSVQAEAVTGSRKGISLMPDVNKRKSRLFRGPSHSFSCNHKDEGIASDKQLSAQAALAEFAALRDEALQAFSMQWNTIALQLTATGVLVSFSLSEYSRNGFLLIIPIVSYVLNGRYLRSERNIVLIATYVMEKLSSRVPGGLNWESWLRDRRSPNQILRWVAHGPLLFSVISLVVLAWAVPYILYAHKLSAVDRWALGVLWIVDFILIIISMYTIKIVYGARFKKRLGTDRQV